MRIWQQLTENRDDRTPVELFIGSIDASITLARVGHRRFSGCTPGGVPKVAVGREMRFPTLAFSDSPKAGPSSTVRAGSSAATRALFQASPATPYVASPSFQRSAPFAYTDARATRLSRPNPAAQDKAARRPRS